jgi:hypothetical protein
LIPDGFFPLLPKSNLTPKVLNRLGGTRPFPDPVKGRQKPLGIFGRSEQVSRLQHPGQFVCGYHRHILTPAPLNNNNFPILGDFIQ